MTVQYLYDSKGYLTGVYDGPDVQPNSTPLTPIFTGTKTPQFVDGTWVDQSQLPLLTPMQFYLAFTTKERMMLKALAEDGLPANSAFNATATAVPVDPIVEEFWATYQLAVSSNAHIDPNLASIQEGLEYLASPTAPTPPTITADRIPQILAGIAQ
jgi:hypothetical protein